MIEDNERKYSVYKGLQRPIVFKGLKGHYIFIAFGLALGSLFVFMIATLIGGFLIGALSMAVFVFGGIIAMAIYQRKNGLYNKNIRKGIYIMRSLFSKI